MHLFLLLACSRAPIEDRWSSGSITQLKDSFTSSFAIETAVDGVQGWIVVDTGFNKNAAPLADFLEENNASLSDIQHVVATHGHGDHIGSHENFPNATFHVHENDVGLLEAEGISNIASFNSESPFDVQGATFTPFLIPGHTAGNVAYLVENVLIMGDSGQSTKSGEVQTTGSGFAEDPDLAAKSLEELKDKIAPFATDIEWVVFSHSGPLQGIEAINTYTAP